jgi:hypothetical protein
VDEQRKRSRSCAGCDILNMHGPIFLLAWTAALFYQLELSRVRAIHILHVKLDLLLHIPFQVFVRPALLHIADCPCPTTSYDEMMDNMKSFTFLTEDFLVAVVASCIHHCISRHEQNRKVSSSTPSPPVDLQGQARNSMPSSLTNQYRSRRENTKDNDHSFRFPAGTRNQYVPNEQMIASVDFKFSFL